MVEKGKTVKGGKTMKLNKKANAANSLVLGIVIMLFGAGAIVGGGYLLKELGILGVGVAPTVNIGGIGGGGTGGGDTYELCSGTANVALRYVNTYSDTATEYRNVSAYIYKNDESTYISTVSQTDNAPTTYAAGCKQSFTYKIVSGAGNTGGEIKFGPVLSAETRDFSGAQFDDTKARVFSVTENRFDNTSASGTGYQDANVTALNASSGAGNTYLLTNDYTYAFRWDIRTKNADTVYGDHGSVIYCLDYDAAELNMPSLKVNGRLMTNADKYDSGGILGLTTASTSTAKCYKDNNYITGKADTTVEISFYSLSGVDPADNQRLWVLAEGAYLSVDGKTIKWGVQKDDPSQSWQTRPGYRP